MIIGKSRNINHLNVFQIKQVYYLHLRNMKSSSDLLRKFYIANIQAIMKRIFITRLTYAQHVKRPYILIVVLHHDR